MRIDHKLFNPANQSKELLIENFVVRTKVFEKIFKDIRTGKMSYPEQHYLVQGLRGMGKTTLLLRLQYEVEKEKNLKEWLIPVFFNEESYDLTSLSNLWEKLLKYLDDYFGTGGTFYDATEKFMGSNDYEKKCFDLLLDTLHESKKKLLILFDNFGELFLDNLSEKETHRFREILMNNNDIRIVAASAIVLEDQHDYSKPFFEFFKIIYLDGLSKEETFELIIKLQEKEKDKKIDIQKNRAKIETLALLTGGVIRTILLLYEVLLSDENGTALRDLDVILDRITPLYKHRMEGLSVQQRKIVDVVAKSWDAISVKDITGKIREDGKQMQGKAISAQLAQLEKNNVIDKKGTTTKNNFYQLKERFFNIWYLMRNGDRYDRCRVIWLTKFLEMWYDDEDKGIDEFINLHIQRLKKGTYYPDAALLIVQAIFNSEKIPFKNKKRLINETEKILPQNLIGKLPDIKNYKNKEVLQFIANDDFDSALRLLKEDGIKKKENIFSLAILYFLQSNHDKASIYFKKLRLGGDINFALMEAFSLMRSGKLKEAKEVFELDFNNKESFGYTESARYLALIYLAEKKDKEKALYYINNSDNQTKTKIAKIKILLWKNDISNAILLLDEIIHHDFSEILDDELSNILLFLIAKKQYQIVLKLFNTPKHNLKEKLKPIFFALMHFMKDGYPNEYLKMGSELESTVQEIISNIHKLAIDYA